MSRAAMRASMRSPRTCESPGLPGSGLSVGMRICTPVDNYGGSGVSMSSHGLFRMPDLTGQHVPLLDRPGRLALPPGAERMLRRRTQTMADDEHQRRALSANEPIHLAVGAWLVSEDVPHLPGTTTAGRCLGGDPPAPWAGDVQLLPVIGQCESLPELI